MFFVPLKRSKSFAACFFFISSCFISLPLKAASSLAAWSINSNGVLNLRTSVNTKLEAYYQSANHRTGDRVWINFSGELSMPRTLRGNGPIKEVRLGKPSDGQTRLVVELNPGMSFDYSKLKLIGTAPDKWEMRLVGISKRRLKYIGEGNVVKNSSTPRSRPRVVEEIDFSSLPTVQRDRYRIVIDPGHGGPDPGAVGINGLKETDIVLDVSRKVANYLSSKGVNSIMTRRIERNLDLQPRVSIANKSRADAFISIHANATRKGYRKDVNGIETYYYSGSKGLKLANDIHNQILAVSYPTPDRGVRKSRFYVIRKTLMPAVLVEVGFVTGTLDSKLLRTSEYRQKVAFAIAKGILNYLKEVN